MYCDKCLTESSTFHRTIIDGETLVICDTCYAHDLNTVTSATERSLTLAPTSIPLLDKPKEKGIQCSMCYKTLTLEQAKWMDKKIYCTECETYFSALTFWTENPTQGEKFMYFDLDTLRQYCTAEEEWFTTLPNAKVIETSNGSFYIFIDNDGDHLAVGHLDKSNGSLDRKYFMHYEGTDTARHFIYNGNLDDRLGVYIICHVLPQVFGLKYDILLTTDEESGGSTALFFSEDFLKEKRKSYKWGFEFDRHGIEPVLYMYDDKEEGEWVKAIKEVTEIAYGSLSDISYLDELGCKFVNWGTGYYREHTSKHFCILEETHECILKFLKFYEKNKDVAFPHEYVPPTRAYNRYGADWDNVQWWKNAEAKVVKCDVCHKECTARYYGKDGVMRCKDCHANISKMKSVHLYVCDECHNSCPYLVMYKAYELCYDCYTSQFRRHKESICDSCHAKGEVYEIYGQKYCAQCYVDMELENE